MLKINKLFFKYNKQKPLFESLNINIQEGSIIGLLGENGAGKTSLLNLIAGLLKPDYGEIKISGKIPFERHPDFLNQLFYVPENIYLPDISFQNYIKASTAMYPDFDFNKFEKILKSFELFTEKTLGELSYGQQKKFVIAFALATNSKVLLFDEPTNGLDIPSKTIFRKILAESVSENQIALISTHQIKEIENLIDKIIILKNGNIIFNQQIYDIAQNLEFNTIRHTENIKYLYREETPEGYKIIKYKTGAETVIDIELLFNALNTGVNIYFNEKDNQN